MGERLVSSGTIMQNWQKLVALPKIQRVQNRHLIQASPLKRNVSIAAAPFCALINIALAIWLERAERVSSIQPLITSAFDWYATRNIRECFDQ